jgi:hypothetical protein
MKNTIKNACLALALAAAITSCKKSNTPTEIADPTGNYILTVTPVASTGVADYLLTANNLDTGTISTAGNGLEQDGTYRYYVTHNNKFFSLLYGQGNPGAVTTYNILDGKLNKLSNFQTETVQAFAPVNNDLLLVKIPRTYGNKANWYQINTDNLLIKGEGQLDVANLTGNGETAHFSWLKQVGNKVFAPYFSIKGCCGDGFGTNSPDSAWVAVYDYPSMKLEKIIKDNRTSFIGRYFVDGLGVVENGDTYAFSSAVATTGGVLSSKKPSAITRINAGTTEFDLTYYFNFQEASGGMNITDWIYVGAGNFVVNATTAAEKGAYATGKHIGILNVTNKTFKTVAGMPELSKIGSITSHNFSPVDGKTAYIGVTLTDGSSYVYKIDAGTATATRGLKVEGGVVTSISKL